MSLGKVGDSRSDRGREEEVTSRAHARKLHMASVFRRGLATWAYNVDAHSARADVRPGTKLEGHGQKKARLTFRKAQTCCY